MHPTSQAIKKDHLIGSLEVGKKADIITNDLDHPRLTPNTNPVSTIVYAAKGSDVDNSIIDGKWVMQNRKVLTMDRDAIIKNANKAIVPLLKVAGIENKSRWPTIA